VGKVWYKLFIGVMSAIVFITFAAILFYGFSYYRIGLEERYYHPLNAMLKPSGIMGHGMGIVGSFLIIVGVVTYMARKRYRFLSRMGILKHWLEFHIFLCTLGPILILFHTALKFGGLVAISFWSMVAVFLSGVVGRFIYLQIPRSIEGRELSLNEVRELKTDVAGFVKTTYNLDEESYNIIADSIKRKVEIYHKSALVRFINKYFDDRRSLLNVRTVLRMHKVPKAEYKQIVSLLKDDINLNRKIERLDSMQNLFKYWHVAHFPFALVMLIIMIIHVAVTIVFGYRWVF
jgi:sulfur relay (sulfurtransferase) DsrC/TusE family protein